MSKTKAEESKELDDQVAEFLERGGEVQQIDTREAKLKDMMVSNRFFAKTNYLMFKTSRISAWIRLGQQHGTCP